MAQKTIQDLEAVQDKLVEARRAAAYSLCNGLTEENIRKLASVEVALMALDSVIEEGEDEPKTDVSAMIP